MTELLFKKLIKSAEKFNVERTQERIKRRTPKRFPNCQHPLHPTEPPSGSKPFGSHGSEAERSEATSAKEENYTSNDYKEERVPLFGQCETMYLKAEKHTPSQDNCDPHEI